MIAKLINKFKEQLEDKYIEKLAGLVKPLRYEDSEGNIIIIPVEYNTKVNFTNSCDITKYYDLVPDSSKSSIVYFESEGIDDAEQISSHYLYKECDIKLIYWCNLKRINKNYTNADPLMADLLDDIPTRLDNVDYLSQILVTFTGVEKTENVFSPYTYEEAIDQYLLYPFDYFALNFNIKFAIPVNSCADSLILDPVIC